MDTNYFVCTLGQAAALKKNDHEFRNISQFLERQANRVGDRPAVGFLYPRTPDSGPWDHHVLTFGDVYKGVRFTAELLAESLGADVPPGSTVALLCPSSADFLFTWLALMHLGYAVMLLAPQCQPSAIAHLCKSCEVSRLFYDDVYESQAQASAQMMKDEGVADFSALLVPSSRYDVSEIVREPLRNGPQGPPAVGETDVAYLHHTSGTSTGLPKPIPQTHRAGLGVLPRLDGSSKATFTTTPLYHGGIADLFRAWASDALIWLFPGKGAPITAGNIIRCLEVAEKCAKWGIAPPVKYFSSVPYVLQMMEADKKGMEFLTSMDIVGVGGAALPAEVGDRLVEKGVNLISRFGSAECGFLMSSHRDYAKDREWQYLRSLQGAEALRFEKQEDGTSELIVMPGQKNRPDGSFATADLFVPHPEIPNAWKYHSRADSQLTLITGKKFDPAPLESAIAADNHVDDVLIFGNGRPFPGALLFRSKDCADISDAELIEALRPTIERLNTESQDHARIPRNMLVPVPYQESNLDKSSKGTILRGKAEERYAQAIEDAYVKLSAVNGADVPDEKVSEFLIRQVQSIVAKETELTEETDLFAYGVDSVACMQLRYGLRQLLPKGSEELPLSIVEDCGTIRRLSNYILKQRHGEAYTDTEDETQMMLDLVEEYGMFEDTDQANGHVDRQSNGSASDGEVVVLTGATGALGAHILDHYRNEKATRKIYCLVRGSDEHAARGRISKALSQRGLVDLTSDDEANEKITVLRAHLGDPRLGLDDSTYEKLCHEATIIIHVAWSVNFRMRLRSFVKDNIATPRFAYCSSVASVIASSSQSAIPEAIITDPTAASPLGYSRSKWVAENICYRAHQQTRLRSRISVFRVGQLAGDTKHGVWNTKEAWPMMLSTVRLTGCLPDLKDEPLAWLPVDVAAQAFVEATAHVSSSQAGEGMKVYHVLNEHQTPLWTEMLRWLQKSEEFEIVEPREWVERLEGMQEKMKDHAALKLLDHWKKAYAEEKEEGDTVKGPRFELGETKRAAKVMREVRPVDEEYFGKMWRWLQTSMEL
ncbi:hypothetical protein H2199_003324 [Coniosporium tulheliwenetii]|uniref:Uncharacterized protein n=1 Tax=Coniosporium tulheliwenetii TaxID=3383036 RepID=A0ACC2ZDA9_9PEZI|nr:hypothetical protein H2199_003324 [Cladosporium sp. JES 115]